MRDINFLADSDSLCVCVVLCVGVTSRLLAGHLQFSGVGRHPCYCVGLCKFVCTQEHGACEWVRGGGYRISGVCHEKC